MCQEIGQCRFCLGEEAAAALVAPCACDGSVRLVHPACLARWQRRQAAGVQHCEVCSAPWARPFDDAARELWLRRVLADARHEALDAAALGPEAQAAARAQLRVGALIVQTPLRAAQTGDQVLAASAASQGDSAALDLFASVGREGPRMPWLKSVFAIVFVGQGICADGSATIVAMNLARAAPEGDAARRTSELWSSLRGTVPEGTLPVRVLSGGPCHTSEVLCCIGLDRTEGAGPATGGTASDPLDVIALELPGADGLDVVIGAPSSIASAAQGRRARFALLAVGCAVWSSAQLISEVSRGRWGLCSGRLEDLMQQNGLWEACWRDRQPLRAAEKDDEGYHRSDGCS